MIRLTGRYQPSSVAGTAKQAGRQKKQGFDESKGRGNAESEKAKRNGDNPDERSQKQKQQSQRPAQGEKQAPQQKDSEYFHGLMGGNTPQRRLKLRFPFNGPDEISTTTGKYSNPHYSIDGVLILSTGARQT